MEPKINDMDEIYTAIAGLKGGGAKGPQLWGEDKIRELHRLLSEGYSKEYAAGQLGCSLGTVRNYINRAKEEANASAK